MAISQPNTSDSVPLPQGRVQEAASSTSAAEWVSQAERAVRAASEALVDVSSQLDEWDSKYVSCLVQKVP